MTRYILRCNIVEKKQFLEGVAKNKERLRAISSSVAHGSFIFEEEERWKELRMCNACCSLVDLATLSVDFRTPSVSIDMGNTLTDPLKRPNPSFLGPFYQ